MVYTYLQVHNYLDLKGNYIKDSAHWSPEALIIITAGILIIHTFYFSVSTRRQFWRRNGMLPGYIIATSNIDTATSYKFKQVAHGTYILVSLSPCGIHQRPSGAAFHVMSWLRFLFGTLTIAGLAVADGNLDAVRVGILASLFYIAHPAFFSWARWCSWTIDKAKHHVVWPSSCLLPAKVWLRAR